MSNCSLHFLSNHSSFWSPDVVQRALATFIQGVSSCAPQPPPPPNCFYAPWRAFNLHSFRRLVLTWHGDNENSHVQRCQSVYGNRHWPLRAHSFSVKFSQRAARWRISVYALRLDWRNVDVFSPSVGIKSSEPK